MKLIATEMSAGASVYAAHGIGFTLEEKLEEVKFSEVDDELTVEYPSSVYLTAKASDEGLDSAFRLTASYTQVVIEIIEETALALWKPGFNSYRQIEVLWGCFERVGHHRS